jgi:SAM-dependent methyltransferase
MASTFEQEFGVFPRPSHDEAARQRYAMGLRQYLFGPLREAVGRAFYAKVAPEYEAREGRPLSDRVEARRAVLELPGYQYFSDLHRISQEMIWNSVIDTLDRTEVSLREKYRGLNGDTLGSIRLDPELPIPKYVSTIDIHCMPGNYQRSTDDCDLVAGALYDRGGYLYSPSGGPQRGGSGHTSVNYLRTHFPDLEPRRILDIGCGVGAPTLVYVDAFPAAQVHAIDIGAAMLRYGHLRAETLGRRVHFSQQNAEHTDFESGSFDLVVSHIMFHETSAKAVQPILTECRRLLRPGGVMLHLDLPHPDRLPDVFTKVIFDGDAYYNNEPFWMRMHDLDWPAMMRNAGFEPERVRVDVTRLQTFEPPSAEHPAGRWVAGRFFLTAFAASVAPS